LKILQVTQNFKPYPGGQEKYVLELSKKLKEFGHDITVYTTNRFNLPKFEQNDGLDVYRFNMLFCPLNNPISLEFLKTYRNLKNYDVINVHNEHSFLSFITILYKFVHKKPIVLTHHGQLKFGLYYKDIFERFYERTIGKLLFNSVEMIAANSEADKDFIASLGVNGDKIKVLHNAINPESLMLHKEMKIENLNPESSNKKIVLFVGRIIERKGVEFLIKSAKVVTKIHDNVLFAIIGDGPYRRQVEKLVKYLKIQNNVLFLGEVSDEVLYNYYKSADIFVLPSLSEVCPTVVLEAMYFGLPVVTTDIPGVRDHFKDVALLVPPRNEDELAEAIVKLLDDVALRGGLSKAGEKLVKSKYTWDVVAKEYEEIYFRMLEDTN
jgi:glycosyltransferase involved in cell wall biosynthesis